jgi:HD-like signal output (HDOD) protein
MRREPNPERFFVAGMLHDIGRLILYTKISGQARDALMKAQSGNALLYEAEREVLGFTHAVVGGILLQTWRLPTSLEEVVMFHHNPGAANRFPVETAIIHVADIISHALGLGSSGEKFVPPLDTNAWERLGLSPAALGTIEDHIDRLYQETVATILAPGHA